MLKKFLLILVAVLATVGVVAATASAGTTVRVTGNTVDVSAGENGSTGWWFNRDASTSTPYEFDFDQHSIGYGSLEVLPIGTNPADKFIGELFMFSDLSQLTFSADYFLGPNSDAQQVYVNVYATDPGSSPTKFYDCRFDFVATGTDTPGVWQTLSFGQGDPATNVTTRGGVNGRNPANGPCPSTLAGMPTGSMVRAVALSFGDTSANDAGMGVRFDNVVVGDTTYDFEVPLAVKDSCKDGGYVRFGFANQGQCISSLQANTNAGK